MQTTRKFGMQAVGSRKCAAIECWIQQSDIKNSAKIVFPVPPLSLSPATLVTEPATQGLGELGRGRWRGGRGGSS